MLEARGRVQSAQAGVIARPARIWHPECMNRIHKDELFGHVSTFLKSKGIELQSGSYTSAIEKGCQVLADTINLSQQALERAKTEVEEKLEKARDVIHTRTAPRGRPPEADPSGAPPTASRKPKSRAGARGPRAPKSASSRVRRPRPIA